MFLMTKLEQPINGQFSSVWLFLVWFGSVRFCCFHCKFVFRFYSDRTFYSSHEFDVCAKRKMVFQLNESFESDFSLNQLKQLSHKCLYNKCTCFGIVSEYVHRPIIFRLKMVKDIEIVRCKSCYLATLAAQNEKWANQAFRISSSTI